MNKKTVAIFTPAFWQHFWTLLTEHALYAALQIAALVALYFLLRAGLLRLLDTLLNGLLNRESRAGVSEERTARLQTLQGLGRSVISYALFFLFGILILQAVGFNVVPLLTTASVVGVAIALGSQKLFKDVISGFFLIVDTLFVVGDTVTIGGVTGTALEIGMRVTRVLDDTGRLHLFANGDIGTVVNLSRYPVSDYIEIGLAGSADLNAALKAIDAAGQALYDKQQANAAEAGSPAPILKAAPIAQGVTGLSAATVTVRVSLVAAPRDLLQAQMAVRRAVLDALRDAAIPLA